MLRYKKHLNVQFWQAIYTLKEDETRLYTSPLANGILTYDISSIARPTIYNLRQILLMINW